MASHGAQLRASLPGARAQGGGATDGMGDRGAGAGTLAGAGAAEEGAEGESDWFYALVWNMAL